MSTPKKTFLLGLFLLMNACGAGAAAGSSRFENLGGGQGGGLARTWEANPPAAAESRALERSIESRADMGRDRAAFRLESDCWRCR